MILGIGCDIVENLRFGTVGDEVIKRIFSSDEIIESCNLTDNRKLEFYASRFAVRESVSKATNIPIFELSGNAIIVKKHKCGAPFVECSKTISERIKNNFGIRNFKLHISISHENKFSIAYAILENEWEKTGSVR